MDCFSTRRAASVFLVLATVFSMLLARVAYLQTIGRRDNLGRAEHQQHQTTVLTAARGRIYDRNSFPLAITIEKQDLFADPRFIRDICNEPGHSVAEIDNLIIALARILDRDALDLATLFHDKEQKRFIRIAEDVDESRRKAIEKLNMPGIGFVPSHSRSYPAGALASHILGGMGADGKGLDGIEMRFNEILAGKNGWERKLKDARRRAIGVEADDYLPPKHGQHLILTIDANIQMLAEQELAATCTAFNAERGELVVMDPNNGEVLALCNWPTFDPNDLVASNDRRRDRSLTDPYEPGSTIKPFIVGPALQWHQTQLTERWPIPGGVYLTPYGRPIRDVHGVGALVTWDVLVKSSNIGMSMLGERMGNEKLRTALDSFGFGKRTGIELPAEDPGLLNPLKKWSKYSTESASQGYELMVTPVQLCRAFCAYANGGRLVKPTIIRGVLDADGSVVSRSTSEKLGILPVAVDPAASRQIRQILCDVPIRGTAAGLGRSQIWNIFGKTGTAHISMGRSGYSPDQYNSSFICAAPAENPRLAVAFIVHKPDPKIAKFGGAVAAPGAKRFVERTLAYLQVPASPDPQLPPENISNVLWHFNPKAYKRTAPPMETASTTTER